MAEHWLLMGRSKGIPYFALPVHAAFALPIKKLLPQTTSLLTFLLFSPHPTREGSAQAAG